MMENNFVKENSFVIKAQLSADHPCCGLSIRYSFSETLFGKMLIASTGCGVCYLAFVVCGNDDALAELEKRFPGAVFAQGTDKHQCRALEALSAWDDGKEPETVCLHLIGTEFRLRVWRELLKIPFGGTSTYAKIAAALQMDKACRAVGTAVGGNPVSILIPCHRVLRTDGSLGGYHWGLENKRMLLEWESNR